MIRKSTSNKENPQRPWEPMAVSYAGTVGEVVRGGGGKLSAPTGDPGEPRKVPGGDTGG